MKTKLSEMMKTAHEKESESSQREDLRHSKCSSLPILMQVMQQQSQKSQAPSLLSFRLLSNCRL